MNRTEIPLSADVKFLPQNSCLVNKANQEVHLTPNERRLLKLIIAGKGRKEIIIEEVWRSRGTIVGESSYHQLIKMLREKLQLAGLPDSVIKTIPRYGIRLVPYESDVALPFVPGEGESLLSSSSNEKASSEDAVMNAFPETTSSYTEGEIPAPLLPAETENMLKGPGIHQDKAMIIIIAGILAGLVLILYLGVLWVKPNPFPYQFKIDRVAFHLSSLRNEDQRTYLQLKGKLGKEVRHVYIASNGPKVWVASCENEIDDKEVKCHYQIHSVY